jgi:hypothetical protein
MLKTAFLTLLSLAIAIGGGGGSVWYALKIQDGVGAIRIGQWTAFPDIGTPAADAHFRHHHDIELVAGSKASVAMGTLVAHSHCVHHQAVDTLGAGLVVTAWCDDVIEGVELPDRWVVGVQWHPEDDAADEPAQQALFDAFVTASREQSPSRAL